MSQPRQGSARPTDAPDTLYVLAPGVDENGCRLMAEEAVRLTRLDVPRVSGRGARGLRPFYGAGFYGVSWIHPYIWYQERGTSPHTMRKLAGRVIPMWVDDSTGQLAKDQKKPRTRVTEDGRKQTLIFRRVARMGQRKVVRRSIGGSEVTTSVPASYPGAPGRIAGREGRGRISTGNVGVRWRHPGLRAAGTIETAVLKVAAYSGVGQPSVQTTSRVQ